MTDAFDSTDPWDLLRRWRDGDHAAGSDLIDATYPRLARFFRNKVVRVPDDTDLTQQTMVALVEAKERSGDIASFWGLTFRIARNVLHNYVRKKYKRAREEIDFAAVCVDELEPGAPSSVAISGWKARAFVEALRSVPVADQILLELRYFEGHTAREIGDLLGLPRGSVHRNLERSVDRLRDVVTALLSAGRNRTEPPTYADDTPTYADLDAWAASVRARLDSA